MYPIKNLKRRVRRTTLTITGVALAITLLVIMLSIGEGVRTSAFSLLESGEIDIFVLPKGSRPLIGISNMENGTGIANAIKNYSEVKLAFPVLYYSIFVSKLPNGTDPKNITDAYAIGVKPEMMSDFEGFDLAGGQRVSSKEIETKEDIFANDYYYLNGIYPDGLYSKNFTGEVVVNKVLAKYLKISIGETVYLGVTKLSTSVLFRVCDIVEPTFEYPTLKSITLHLSELQYITRTKNDTVSEILVELHEPSKAKELKNRIEKNFVCSPYIQEDFYNEINKYTKVFEGFSNMIVIITSLVTVVFIGTIMVISVREMACEFGALRAMGISKKTIYKFVLAQSFTICVIGSAIGLFIGYFGTNLLDTYIKSIYHQLPKSIHIALLTPFVIAEITIFAIIIGTISGLIPSILVSRMKIADVIRGE